MNMTLKIFILFLLSGCSVGPSYRPPCIEVPCSWKNSQDCCEDIEPIYDDRWWEVFDDEELNELEEWALENNRNLYIAYERIEQARALKCVAAADFYPQFGLNPDFTSTMELIKNFSNLTGRSKEFRVHEVLYFLPITANYEVDLWGKIRDQYANAGYLLDAQIEDYNVVMLTLTSDLAGAYYQLRAADTQLDLLSATLKTREKAFEINNSRYEGRIVNYSDVTLSGEEISTVQAQYDEIVRQRSILENQVAILIGTPAPDFCMEHNPLKGLPPCIPEGIPSEVLLRRPDVAEAEYKAMAENALVKRAYSLFFPSLLLTGSLAYESPDFKQFMKWISRYWSIGASSAQVLFDAGKTYYNLEYNFANFRAASGAYQQQVLIAFQEVEDALSNLDSYAKQYNSMQNAVTWAEKSHQIYLDRYTLGVTYYIDVVNTERDLLNYQLNLNNFLGFRYLSTIQLIKSLGGGWGCEEKDES